MVYGAGKDSVFDLRETEWDNQYKTEQTLDATLTSAEALSASIEQLVDAKRLEVDNSAANALSQVVRDQQVIALIGSAVLVISLLILIFYVRGNLIKRLLRVIDGMRRVANQALPPSGPRKMSPANAKSPKPNVAAPCWNWPTRSRHR